MTTFHNGRLRFDPFIKPKRDNATDRKPQTSNPTKMYLARTAVFTTVELLEQIFLHLPIIDVLTSTHVQNSWRAVIENSVAIRSHLVHPQTPMYTYKIYGRHQPMPNTFISITSRTAHALRTHFMMTVDTGKIAIYKPSEKEDHATYVFIPSNGRKVQVLEERQMSVRFSAGRKTGSVAWRNIEDGKVICCRVFGEQSIIRQKDPWQNGEVVVREFFMECYKKQRSTVAKLGRRMSRLRVKSPRKK